ncbi:MAG: hypothetical protein WC627_09405 [Legionella sp.]|jgi:hypothetical protein
MQIHYKETANPRYIYINPNTNTVHLLVPINTGTLIGLDNTCMAFEALDSFFGNDNQNSSALTSLNQYKISLEADINAMEDNDLRRLKEDRLCQVNEYLASLPKQKPFFNIWNYPEPIKRLASSPKSNLYSMLLRPYYDSNAAYQTNFALFQLRRKDNSLCLCFPTLFDSLNLINGSSYSVRNHKENLISLARNKLECTFPFVITKAINRLVSALTIAYKELFNNPIDFFVNEEILDQLGYEQEGKIYNKKELNDLLAGIISYRDAQLSIFPMQSPFSKYRDTSWTVLIQFFLAEVNFYAHAQQIATINFAAVLDSKPLLANEFSNTIQTAIFQKLSIENVICEFISKHADHFKLKRSLNTKDYKECARRFSQHWEIIKDSPHFDEFMILDHEKKGRFFAHQGAICVDFSDYVRQQWFGKLNFKAHKRANNEVLSLPVELPQRQKHESEVIQSIQTQTELEQQNLLKNLIGTLIRNINCKNNKRQEWFTLNAQTKVSKLEAVLNWVNSTKLDEKKGAQVMALVKEICATKRNPLGFFAPHSLNEFNKTLDELTLKHIETVDATYAKVVSGIS